MAPLPSSRVIPAGWSEHHRPTAEGGMTAVCRIIGPGERTSKYGEPAPVVLVDRVKCRVQQHNQSNEGVQAGRETYTREYLVSLPVKLPGRVLAGTPGHTIIITEAKDPELVGRAFRVEQVLHGSEVWQRDLLCTDDLTMNQRQGDV